MGPAVLLSLICVGVLVPVKVVVSTSFGRLSPRSLSVVGVFLSASLMKRLLKSKGEEDCLIGVFCARSLLLFESLLDMFALLETLSTTVDPSHSLPGIVSFSFHIFGVVFFSLPTWLTYPAVL